MSLQAMASGLGQQAGERQGDLLLTGWFVKKPPKEGKKGARQKTRFFELYPFEMRSGRAAGGRAAAGLAAAAVGRDTFAPLAAAAVGGWHARVKWGE